MEFQFRRDNRAKPIAIFSMGTEAFSHWFEDELGTDKEKVQSLIAVLNDLSLRQMKQKHYQGKEFTLHLDQDEVELKAHRLSHEQDHTLPEGTELQDTELTAGCGIEDFKRAVISWHDFI